MNQLSITPPPLVLFRCIRTPLIQLISGSAGSRNYERCRLDSSTAIRCRRKRQIETHSEAKPLNMLRMNVHVNLTHAHSLSFYALYVCRGCGCVYIHTHKQKETHCLHEA
ncbi:hypothetical protein XENORESO_001096 [Xenotaenia resolanae]|uniref:Uncharacterized protein n=1 Tax=Xenotaenia resolanae TaxID=208358 RepID=A0ABV0WUA8_9TELE